jgi:hypothetical protein
VPHPSSTFQIADNAIRENVDNTGIPADTGDEITLVNTDDAALALMISVFVEGDSLTNAELLYQLRYGGLDLITEGNIQSVKRYNTQNDEILQRMYPLFVPSGQELKSKVSISTSDGSESYTHRTRFVAVPLNDNQLP